MPGSSPYHSLCIISLSHVHPSAWHMVLLGGILAGVQSLHQKVFPFGSSFPNRMLELYLFNLFFSKDEIISDPQPLPVPLICLGPALHSLPLAAWSCSLLEGPADEATLLLLDCRYTMALLSLG